MSDENLFTIERIYLKDTSFETPNAPGIFTEEWNPDTNLQLNTRVNTMDDGFYEVELLITITVKSNDKTAFLVEVNQAGIFQIKGYGEEMDHILASFCPSQLYPYAREAIAGLVSKGSFPEMHLSPINFDALYQEKLAEAQTDESDKKAN